MSTLIMETFAEFFKYGEPITKLPELEVKMPVNTLALAIAAVLYSLFNFHSSSESVYLLGQACSYFISR